MIHPPESNSKNFVFMGFCFFVQSEHVTKAQCLSTSVPHILMVYILSSFFEPSREHHQSQPTALVKKNTYPYHQTQLFKPMACARKSRKSEAGIFFHCSFGGTVFQAKSQKTQNRTELKIEPGKSKLYVFQEPEIGWHLCCPHRLEPQRRKRTADQNNNQLGMTCFRQCVSKKQLDLNVCFGKNLAQRSATNNPFVKRTLC